MNTTRIIVLNGIDSKMNDKAKEIVDNLLSDKKLYKKMSKKEGEVWGTVFSNEPRNEALKDDQKSAAELKLNRNARGLSQQLRKHGLKPGDGLSLACGGGRAEREFLDRGICSYFHGVDIAKAALNEAKAMAKENDYNITYEHADLNNLVLEKNRYDLVVAQNCLHHVLQLEYLADQVRDSIRADGVLWITDYIGETQFQYDDERMDLINKIRDILPDGYREDRVNQRTLGKLVRRDPGTLISPFEAIRSAETIPIFLERFDVIEKHETNSFLDLVCPVGTRHNYLQSEESRNIFELLLIFDQLLVDKKIMTPRMGSFLLKPKQ